MEELINIIADVLGIDKKDITINSRRDEIEEWDSLAHIQIIAEIEEQFDVNLPFEKVAEIEEISEFLKYIEVV
ncbi:acyl carrier protein [Clostridium tepidiprofundi DSM 19306]|uniref:Acyl carrier protein n=1 Tax=Clostridium tepidiprofundi DSM 19306 TaxID=1121338 RepID=A0A151B4T7_9CLOT|nr:acyl carrier protein [Clostridium tepidiprofundi]KYH34810.1 acyl carrier protein [Clostridium tepidiprofundi DSM 19306]